MDNLGWNNPSILRNTIWSNQYDSFCDSCEKYSIMSGKVELNDEATIHGETIDLARMNEMVEILAPAFNSISDNSILSSHQLCSLPPSISTSPDQNLGPLQELEAFNNFNRSGSNGDISVVFPFGGANLHNLSCSGTNFTSSGESEAVSQSSSQADSSRKRKLDDRRGFQIFFDSHSEPKKPRIETERSSSGLNIDFRQRQNGGMYEPDTEAIAQVKEMMYRAAAMRPVDLVLEECAAEPRPRRKNVRISSDPQTVAARQRRERISERLRMLQRLVPGGNKMDTASMLGEAANYLKFLKSQVTALETLGPFPPPPPPPPPSFI